MMNPKHESASHLWISPIVLFFLRTFCGRKVPLDGSNGPGNILY